MKVKDILNLAPDQDEYLILTNRGIRITITKPDDLPEAYENIEVSSIHGYDAEGFDGLEINLNC